MQGQFGWRGPTTGIKGVDMSEDFRGETRDVQRIRGRGFRFTFGDYIVKCMVGAYDPSIHAIDLPQGMSIYRDGDGACSIS